MSKQVYLFELDSVRKTDREIIIGQQALHNEIVKNGNVVVLTYNQLVDSRGFFSLFRDEKYYNSIVSLFEKGAIKISQFKDIRTVVQYILSVIEDDKKFIYSALPLKYSQKRLTALVKRSLQFSDLSEIYEYVRDEVEENQGKSDDAAENQRKNNELKELFVEIENGKEKQTELSMEEMRGILDNLYGLLSVVLRISALHEIYIPPRNTEEYKELHLHHIIRKVLEWKREKDPLWDEAVEVIQGLTCLENDNRSIYLRQLNEVKIKEKKHYYAEAIINLCHNYACEISICNISKHYDIRELLGENVKGKTFQSDFFLRLQEYWNDGKEIEKRFLQEETNTFEALGAELILPDFEQAVRAVTYFTDNHKKNDKTVPGYEYKMREQHRKHKKTVIFAIVQRVLLSVVCIGVACIMDFLIGGMKGIVDERISLNTWYFWILETILFLYATEAITAALAKRNKWLISLSEAISGIVLFVKDAVYILRGKNDSHINLVFENIDSQETVNKASKINFVRTSSINKYNQFRSLPKNQKYFAEKAEYEIADTKDDEVVRKLLKREELYNEQFGVVYESGYNTLVVDPIRADENTYYPYERVIQSAGNGVVIIPIHNQNFVLLNQARHSIRENQLCFPRGFAESGCTAEENVKRELKEELNAEVIGKPVFLGELTADSGLIGGKVNVYLAEVVMSECAMGHEGILSVKEYSKAQLEECIARKEIEDGFTLAAYAMWCAGKKQHM